MLARGPRAAAPIEGLLDAIVDQAVILDRNGIIVRSNRAWRDFALRNGAKLANVDRGVSYLSVCCGAKDDELAHFSARMAEVLHGRRARFSYEYPCHSQNERRWFLMRCGHLPPGGALVVHVNITARVLAERFAAEAGVKGPDSLSEPSS